MVEATVKNQCVIFALHVEVLDEKCLFEIIEDFSRSEGRQNYQESDRQRATMSHGETPFG
jgi:hypothetical protein